MSRSKIIYPDMLSTQKAFSRTVCTIRIHSFFIRASLGQTQKAYVMIVIREGKGGLKLSILHTLFIEYCAARYVSKC